MGNKILSAYDVQKEACYYNIELRWRLHSASFKDKAEEKLTIFLFEKKVVDRYPKNSKDLVLETLRKDASSLQRLRHPQILSVVEPMCEERGTLVFATRPIVGTVSQLMEHNRYELSPLEIKCGLLDIAEALQFLHQDAKTAHLGLSPQCMFIDPHGRWLLGGLGFSIPGIQWGQLVDCPFAFDNSTEAGNISHEPIPRYAAPEMVAMPGKCGLESDMFAFGLLAYELASTERQPLLRGAPRGYTVNTVRASVLPGDLYPTLTKMLSANPSDRITINAFINSDYFMDVNVRAIRFLEQLNEKDDAQRLTFLKGLPKLLQDTNSPLCSSRILRERILPRLLSALLFTSLYGVVVPVIMSLLKREHTTEPTHFQTRIWPSFKGLFTAKEIPIEVVTLFIKELDVLVTLAAPQDVQSTLVPFVLRCLELQEPTILHEVLEKVPYLHTRFEYRQVKDHVLPRMLQLLVSSSAVKLKVQVLMALGRIHEIFDKTTVIDVVLPAFDKLTRQDRSPAICMCLLGCYDAMSKNLGHKITAEKILPLIMPLLVEESLSCDQFETQLSVCKKLLQRVEAVRRKEYESRSDAQAEAGQASGSGPQQDTKMAARTKEAEPQDFDSLLFAGTQKATAAAAAPALATTPSVIAPPPLSTANNPAGKGGGNLMGMDLSSKAPTGGFDPFGGTSGSGSKSLGSGTFDPFVGTAAAASAPALAPASTGLGGLGGLPPVGGGGAMLVGSMPGSAMSGGLMPAGAGVPNMMSGGLPGGGGGGVGACGGMKNLNYDPFAEIDGSSGGGTLPMGMSPMGGPPMGGPPPMGGSPMGGPPPLGGLPMGGPPPFGGPPMGVPQLGGQAQAGMPQLPSQQLGGLGGFPPMGGMGMSGQAAAGYL
eukprot:TRINITY_DN11743_c0_g2_i1.p1 TRINITY_DN11743_c0_g2~~TRINITY_DN11743_c0_g2_i1.p1  ORF type:complete len:879 (+),score=145.32 TRINITY_DN11743_c0_g2_i1:116-2752(+)